MTALRSSWRESERGCASEDMSRRCVEKLLTVCGYKMVLSGCIDMVFCGRVSHSPAAYKASNVCADATACRRSSNRKAFTRNRNAVTAVLAEAVAPPRSRVVAACSSAGREEWEERPLAPAGCIANKRQRS